MKKSFKQTCPECYNEVFLNSKEDKVIICPKCGSRKIFRQILEELEYDNEISKEKAIEPAWGVSTEDEYFAENSIDLKYKSGIIKTTFELKIREENTPCTLGRSAYGKEYFKDDQRISNEHFGIIVEDGKWEIIDMDSTNGTMVNDEVIQGKNKVLLKDGDLIRLGKTNTSVVLEVRKNDVC